MEESVSLQITENGIAYIVFNRPQKRNAFDEIVISKLSDIFDTLHGNENVRLVFLKGAGGYFSSGGDLEFLERIARHTIDDDTVDAMDSATMLNKLYRLPQYTVALVEGGAYGNALGIIAACNYAIATKDTKFCFAETSIGLLPSLVAPYVIEAIGVKNARAYMPSALDFDAECAREIGLVQEVADDVEDMAKRQEQIAAKIFKTSPSALFEADEMIAKVKNREIDSRLMKETAKLLAVRGETADGLEGMRAFLEKREPKWEKE